MITELRVQNWRCLRDVTVDLTPLHAFIGPNDSGKSTLLRALQEAQGFGTAEAPGEFSLRTERVQVVASKSFRSLMVTLDGHEVDLHDDGILDIVRAELGRSRMLKLDPDQLREPSPLVVNDELALSERGRGLPGVYDAILNRDREAWDSIELGVRTAFPTVKRLALKAVSPSAKVLEVELLDGTRVPATAMSEGLLYWLAFACLRHVSPVKLLLIEEPENGLHPARIRAVVQSLRALSESGTQVVLATHSPILVNELTPEEVSVVTRTPEEGTRVRRVSTIPDLDRLLSVFNLGELWLAFADGKEEAGLFESKRDTA